MGALTLRGFKGEVPQADPLVLPEACAQVARNVKFDGGNLTPMRGTEALHTFGTDAETFYLMGTTWLSWPTVVDVAKAPVASGRIYYTGDGAPKVRNGSTVYGLALLPPAAGPILTNLTAPDAAFLVDVYYAYTFVTSLGEESQPSPLSAILTTSPTTVVQVTGFSAAPGGRGITSIRMYRSQTSASGVTALFFVAEFPTATTSYDHNLATTPLAEALPSTDYDPPVSSLTGLVSMPNGMMAAFSDNNVYFCEPYIPHAWPDKYSLTTEWPIVGLAVFGSVLAVLTTGAPYIMQGTHPDSMVSEKMDKALPCMSRRGIVDIGSAALYPSSDGIVLITANDAKVISRNLFSRDQWESFQPQSISAARFDGKYLFMMTVDPDDTYVGGGPSGYAPGAFTDLLGGGPMLSAGVELISGGIVNATFGAQQLGIVNYEGDDPTFSRSDIEVPAATATDQQTSDLYILRADRRSVVNWEDSAADYEALTWRSKPFVQVATTFGAAYIKTPDPVPAGSVFTCQLYAGGVLRATITRANQIVRLPAIPPTMKWEVEMQANVQVTSIHLAGTVDELMGVL